MSNIMKGRDGVDFINIYSKAATPLGRWMSNFAFTPIELPEDGKFNSIEAYWYWLKTGDDRLRTLSGFAAKQLGRSLENKEVDQGVFRAKIAEAIRQKVLANPKWAEELLKSDPLPFTHFYEYGGKRIDAKHEWLVGLWHELRDCWHLISQAEEEMK